ncbi:MAG: class I SAM-dependent methyltransferase [Actinomycetota bacterium]
MESSQAKITLDLNRVYKHRFEWLKSDKRNKTWQIIADWIEKQTDRPQVVLDPAAGSGEFIVASGANERWACDIIDHRGFWPANVKTVFGDIFGLTLPSGYFDMIFVSNFLEHLASPDRVYEYLMRLRDCIKPGGLLVIMGPNYRFCAAEYFDFADHLLPLSDRTIQEHLAAVDLRCERVVPRFLPLSFRSQRYSTPLMVKIYLRLPFVWRFFGKQFFIVASRPPVS